MSPRARKAPIAQPTAVALQRLSTVDSVANAIRDQILDGRLPQGSALREADLCEAFGVSRHTVRSALHSLSFEGLVAQEAHRGAFIPLATAGDIRDIYAMRALLELHAVRWVTGDDAALDDLRAAVEELRGLGADADWGAVRDADLAFHARLVDGIGSRRASSAFAALRMELRLAFLQIRDELSDHGAILRQHEAILAALAAGDAALATSRIEQHLADAVEIIAAGVERQSGIQDEQAH